MFDFVNVKGLKEQILNNVTVNKTEVTQVNSGAVVTGGGPVTFVQSNSNVTTNLTENNLKVR